MTGFHNWSYLSFWRWKQLWNNISKCSSIIREGFTKKKCGKVWWFTKPGGRGSPRTRLYFWKKKVLQGPHRTILGHPKHVLHLVLSPNDIAKAFNVMQCIGLSAPLISDFGLFWANVNWYNRSKYKDFWMGPSVKFVSRINGSFPKKIMVIFLFSEKGQTREGGVRGGLVKRAQFFRFLSSEPFPYPIDKWQR